MSGAAPSSSFSEKDVPGISEASRHLAVIDALLRFGAGTDDIDSVLLKTVFADNAEVDFGPCGEKLGMSFDPLVGSALIIKFLCDTGTRQVTSHAITNLRVSWHDQRANVRALVDATHISRENRTKRFRMTNWYDVVMESSGEQWLVTSMRIDNVWSEGDQTVLGLR